VEVRVRRSVSAVIVDPSHLFRAGLEQLLKRNAYRVVASGGNLAEFPSLNLTASQPALFILSVEEITQGDCQALRDIKARYPAARVVLMGGKFTSQQIHLALQNGADACLLITIKSDALVQSLDLVMLGGKVLSAGLRLFSEDLPAAQSQIQLSGERPESLRTQLSNRELQILRALRDGASNKVIALKHCLTESTVKVHMKAILRKIGAANRTQAAIWARDHEDARPPAGVGDGAGLRPGMTDQDFRSDARFGVS
jgi:two-component system, NarL family, nitrate/nitrite response regulator NarL